MRSMTGYGRGVKNLYGREIIVEIKAVNHRYNEITIKMPRLMNAMEEPLKKILLSEISRGKVDVYVAYSSQCDDDIKVKLNTSLANNYVEVFKEIKGKYNISDEITLSLLSKIPDIITVEKSIASDEANNQILECLIEATKEALNNFVIMRVTEGEALKANIMQKLEIISEILSKIEEKSPEVAKDYEQRLRSKLSEIDGLDFDESRVLSEVLIFSDKACIDEEIIRLKSHIYQMHDIIEEDNPIGRKLDFLVQEMNREINTIGSKSNNIEITNSVVNAKGEIEKIREQIQNIE